MEILLRFFRNTQAISILALFILLVLLRIPGFFYDSEPLFTGAMPLYYGITNLLPDFNWLFKIVAIFLTGFQAIYFNKVLVSQNILDRNTFFPAFFFVIFSGFFPEMQQLHPAMLANTFLLLAFQKIHGLYQQKKPQSRIFDAGFYLGLASLCYLPSLWFFLILITGLNSYQIASIKQIFIGLFGLLCPIYLWIATSYLWDYQLLSPQFYFDQIFGNPFTFQWGGLLHLPLYLTFIGLCIISMKDLSQFIKQKDIKARKAFYINYSCLGLALISLFSVPDIRTNQLHILIIPTAALAANYYLNTEKKKLPSIALFFVLATVVYGFISL